MYDFHSPKQKTAIRSQETEPRPSNIIRIDQNLPGARLDRLITEEMAQILNAMSDASGRRDHQRRQVRAQRREEGVQGRPLRTQAHRQGRQARAEGAETQGHPVRVRGDRTLPAARAERRGIPDRHVLGGREHPPSRRHRPIAVGRPHALADIERQAQKDLRGDTSGTRGRWNPNTRTCSWTACGTSAHGAGTWRTPASSPPSASTAMDVARSSASPRA